MSERGPRTGIQERFGLPIRQLVDQAIHGRPDRARKAQKQLVDGVNSHPFYDPVFSVVEEIQRILLSSQDPQIVKRGASFLESFLLETGSGSSDKGTRVLRLNPPIVEAAGRIKENDEKIKKNKYLSGILPRNYIIMINETIPLIEDFVRGGIAILKMDFLPPAKPGEDLEERDRKRREETRQLRDWVVWRGELNKVWKEKDKDAFIDHNKSEPASLDSEPFFDRRFNGITMRDIEKMQYPLGVEDYDKVTAFILGVLEDPSDLELTIARLFFEPTLFYSESGPTGYRNSNFLAVMNSWNEQFLYQVVYGQNKKRNSQIKDILNKMAKYLGKRKLTNDIFLYSINTVQLSPEFLGDNTEEMKANHPFLRDTLTHYEREVLADPSKPIMIYSDEIGREYFREFILPKLIERLRGLGLLDQYQEAIDYVEKYLDEHTFASEHLEAIKTYFETNVGSEFLKKLNDHSKEIDSITEDVWTSTKEAIHFLPMQEGINIIEFSPDSVASIFGLKTVKFITSGSPENWQININFDLGSYYFSVIGFLNEEGKLLLKAPVETEIPGLYSMLRHIAVLAFHDLVVQGRKEREAEPQQEGLGRTERAKKIRKTGVKTRESHGGSLPRVQTDRELIADVYKKTGYAPRRVELHKRLLNGAREYRVAVELCRQAQEDPNASEGTRAWYKNEVERCRTNLHRTSEKKKKDLPALFRLETIIDPVTEEKRYLETWVVEHTSPKPTPDELQSPVKLFERYYKHSSALSSLEQLKPWFVGQ